ncbi:MAG: hypothetical protein K8I60_22310 [Anaerolineae bacterium]|nr:hypothetical protein [Anaerolineae bacterium]
MRKVPLVVCLALILLLPFSALLAQSELTFRQSVTGTITSGAAVFRYTFAGNEGDTIYASTSSPEADLWLSASLIASNGAVLSESEGYPFGELLVPYALPGTGTYTIEVSRAEDSPTQEGDFTVFLDRAALTPLTLGESQSGSLTLSGQGAFYTVDAASGDIFQYTASGNNLLFSLVTPGGAYITGYTVDDNLIGPFNYALESGRYIIMLQTANEEGTDYSLQVNRVQPQALTPGTALSGTLTESAPPLFSFQSEAGQRWALNALVADAAYASNMTIYRAGDPYYGLGGDSSSGPNGSPRVDPFIAPEADTYFVLLQFDDYSPADASRDYEVTLAESTVETLSQGAKFNGSVGTDSGSAVYIYDGHAGEQLRITLAQTGGEGWPRFRVDWVNGTVMYFEGYSTANASFVLNLPEDGLYFFSIAKANDTPSDVLYSLSLDQVSN